MAPDDCDRNLDKALARHFRSSADAPSAAASPAPALSACPDAEILAAYHDGSLTPEELALWRPHVLSCGDCQLILEHLATPLDVPVALDKVPVLIAAQTTQIPAALAASAASSVSSVPAPPVQSAPAPLSITRPRKTYFRWLVPTGAIAAGLLTWVVIRESGLPKLGPKTESISVQTAENRQAPPPSTPSAPVPSAAPELKRVSPAPNATDQRLSAQLDDLDRDSTKQLGQKEKDQQQSATGLAAGSSGKASQQMRDTEQQLRSRLRALQSPAQNGERRAAHGPRLTQQQQQFQQNQRVLGGSPVDAKKAQAQADAELAREGEALAAQLPPPAAKPSPSETSTFIGSDSIAPQPQPPSKVAKAAAAARTPAPSPTSTSGAPVPAPPAPESAGKAGSSSGAISSATESVTVESTLPSTNLRLASAATRGPQTFNDPAFKSFWRVGSAGSLELSYDNGATWTSQSTGVAADLFTGSAPAAKVCWVVGANGAILRTIDAGKHWLKIHSPVAADILSIHATDAFHATIWLLPDPKSPALQTYKTSDGGLTWSLVPNS